MATVADLQEVIAKGDVFERRVKDFALTPENIAAYQKSMTARGAAISYTVAEERLRFLQANIAEGAPLLLAKGGSYAAMKQMLAHLKAKETDWRLNRTSGQGLCCGKTVNFADDPCGFMHLVAASYAVCLFGCAPCCGAAAVAELFGQICDNFF